MYRVDKVPAWVLCGQCVNSATQVGKTLAKVFAAMAGDEHQLALGIKNTATKRLAELLLPLLLRVLTNFVAYPRVKRR